MMPSCYCLYSYLLKKIKRSKSSRCLQHAEGMWIAIPFSVNYLNIYLIKSFYTGSSLLPLNPKGLIGSQLAAVKLAHPAK